MSTAIPSPSGRARELALLGLLALLWGSSYLLIKLAVPTIPPLTLIAARVTVAAGLLLAAAVWRGERLPPPGPLWARLFLQAWLNSIAAWSLLAWGQQHVDSALAGVLNSTSPIFVCLITLSWTRHERVGALGLAGALLGLSGVVLVVGLQGLRGLGAGSGREVAAQFAVLTGAFLYACAAIHGKRFAALPPTVTAAGTMVCAAGCLLPASLALDRPWTLTPSPEALLAALLLGALSTGLALLLYFRLVRTLGSMGVASQSYLRAGVSVLLGVALLGEEITPGVGLGLCAVILGVAAMNACPGRGAS